jgi:hypothetical protein
MTIVIGQHEFDGPVRAIGEIPAVPGLYAVMHKQNSGLLLVDFDQTENLAESLKKSAAKLSDKKIVLLRCDNRERRKEILQELLREFEFADEEPALAQPA